MPDSLAAEAVQGGHAGTDCLDQLLKEDELYRLQFAGCPSCRQRRGREDRASYGWPKRKTKPPKVDVLPKRPHDANSSSNVLAAFRSRVPKPSVNRL
jgi:hypothetical protein